MFLGPKLNTVFANRWKAVMWSAGVLMTAYCSVPAADEVQQDAKAQVATAHAKSPWALDK